MRTHLAAVGALLFGVFAGAPHAGSCRAADPHPNLVAASLDAALPATAVVTYDSADPTDSDGAPGFVVQPIIDVTDPSTPPDGTDPAVPIEDDVTDPSDGFIVQPTVDATDPAPDPAPDPSDGFVVQPTID